MSALRMVVVSPGDIETFAGRIVSLVREPGARTRMGAGARVHARKFDRGAVMEQYWKLFEQVLKED